MSDPTTPIYNELLERYINVEPIPDEYARTAGQEDHTDPWAFAGDEADAPEDTDKSPTEEWLDNLDPEDPSLIVKRHDGV